MKIKISDIENLENKEMLIDFSEIIEEFNKDLPVLAKLTIKIFGTRIKISGQINANLNLVCDKCLKDFTKKVNIEVEEIFNKETLNINDSAEFEIKSDCFSEDLNGKDEIDITDFIYQSIILDIPNKLVCDINCKGDENINKYINQDIIDPRLEIFKNIKIEKE